MIDLVGLYPYKHSWKVPTTLINPFRYVHSILLLQNYCCCTLSLYYLPFHFTPHIMCDAFSPCKKTSSASAGHIVLPSSPRAPSGYHFCWLPVLLITLFLLFTALIKHFNSLNFQCPALFLLHLPVPRPFLSHTFFLWPWGCPIRMMLFSKNHGFDNGMPLTFVQKHFSII